MWQLAQVNIARLRHPPGAPQLRGFTAALGELNALAERSPGFVWRHRAGGDEDHLDGGELLGDPLLFVNLSVWERYEDLHAFVYRSLHGRFVARRAQWFSPLGAPSTALWWVRAGQPPTPEQAVVRWRHLRRHGPTPQAFGLRRRFDPAGRLQRGRRSTG
jgi:Domain of unknown function (DUF3291)